MAKTMKDIASRLGLSRTTVSLVMQGRGDEYRISRTTQQLIKALVEETDFKPNYFAKALNSGRSAMIGAIFPDVFEPFMSNLVRGIETVLYDRNYSLTISTSRFDAGREQALVEKTVWQGADGIILVPAMPFRNQAPYNSNHIRQLLDIGYPLVAVDRTIPDLATHRVVQDDYGMARTALERLMAGLSKPDTARNRPDDTKGRHSKRSAGRPLLIPCISFDLAASSIEARIQAYIDAMLAAGHETATLLLDRIDPESTDLAERVLPLLESGKPPDAFFVTTAGLAEKLHWLLRRSCSSPVPPIIRFGSSSRWLDSSFIEIPQPHEQMGIAVASLMLDLIDGTSGTAWTGGRPGVCTARAPDGMIELRC
jgi:DNA-binding LacI/PurR family transcriptional regulator